MSTPTRNALLMMLVLISNGMISKTFTTSASSKRPTDERTPIEIHRNDSLKDVIFDDLLQAVPRFRRQDPGIGCVMPQSARNGTYSLLGPLFVEEGERVPYFSILQLTCPPGYAASSTRANFCNQKNNRWFLDLPTCLKTCKPPKSLTVEFTCVIPSNGLFVRRPCDQPVSSGTTASPKCRSGHRSISSNTNIFCSDGRWKYVMPSCRAVCGKITPEGTPDVINGTSAARGEFPWHVAIYSTVDNSGEKAVPQIWCGGSIISRSIVMSAAHCFYHGSAQRPFDIKLFTVAVGKLHSEFVHPEETFDPYIQKSAIRRVEIPDDYEAASSSYTHDLAILTLQTPLIFSDLIMPVCLNFEDDFDEEQTSTGVEAKVSGFGLTDVNGNVSDVLRTAVMPIISKKQCKEESPRGFSKYVTWDKLCAGYTTGIGVCKGDSGGGLVVRSVERSNDETWYLRGIVSTSPKSDAYARCSTNTYATFTRPIKHKRFIENIIFRKGCTMPENPENGKFILLGNVNAAPGEIVIHRSQITLKCDKGFASSDASSNVCDEFADDWIKAHAICNEHYKIVCYFANWAFYKKGLSKFYPEDIDVSLCTHIVYSFAILDEKSLVMVTQDSWADIEHKLYERVTALKDKGLKVSLCLGGWDDSAGDKYSRLVNDPEARKKFVEHAVAFLRQHNFDGLEIHWKYPTCWQADCSKGPQSDKPAFAALIHELKEAFEPHEMLLSAAVPASKTLIDAGFDIVSLAADLDWIGVLAYDYHGSSESETGHVAPLYYHPDDEISGFNVNYSMNYWLEKGAPSRKLLLGMAFHGRSFTLNVSLESPADQVSYNKQHGLYAPAKAGGKAGEYTKTEGILAYNEICDRIKNHGWTVVKDEKGRMGPHAYKDDQWVSFDDRAMVNKKSKYAKSLNLGGAVLWSLDLDDFTNRCGEGTFPLLNQVRDVLQDT